jgi:hypothetical protein
VAAADRSAARRAARAIDADRKPKALIVETLLETDNAPRLEIAPKEGAHDLGMVLDSMQGMVLDPVAQRDHAAHPHPLLL